MIRVGKDQLVRSLNLEWAEPDHTGYEAVYNLNLSVISQLCNTTTQVKIY